MFKLLILSSLLFLSLSHTYAKVEFRWLSVASVVLDDGETKILFDPMFTRAGLRHWFLLSPLKSDEALVKEVLQENDLSKLSAVFASHSHYDHVIDAPTVAKLTGATFYVDENSEIIARAHKEQKIKTTRFQNLEKIQIGQFSIRLIKRNHSPIRVIHADWLAGPVPKNFNFSFYDYHVGDTWFYLIEHPSGKILLDQGSEPFISELKPFAEKVDVVIQGIANRSSDEAILSGYTEALKAKTFIPVHFDNFFFGFYPHEKTSFLPGVRMESLIGKMREKYSDVTVVTPEYGKKILILK